MNYCETCRDMNCCINQYITLTPRELHFIQTSIDPPPVRVFGKIGVMHANPCSFLLVNKCSIYSDRPLACQSYPLGISISTQEIKMVWLPYCTGISPPKSNLIEDQFILERNNKDIRDYAGISLEEQIRMMIAAYLLITEIKLANLKMSKLDKDNYEQYLLSKAKNVKLYNGQLFSIMSTEIFSAFVQGMNEILSTYPELPYNVIINLYVAKLLPQVQQFLESIDAI